MGEEIAGQDEERDRHDLEAFDAGEQLQRDRFSRHLGQREQEGQHRQAERDRDRHARQHQRDQQHEHDADAHALRQLDEPDLLREADRHDQDSGNRMRIKRRADLPLAFARAALGAGMRAACSGVDFDALDLARHRDAASSPVQ